jgi:hypothetical protein
MDQTGRQTANLENQLAQTRYGNMLPLYGQERQNQQNAMGMGGQLGLQLQQLLGQAGGNIQSGAAQGMGAQYGAWGQNQGAFQQMFMQALQSAMGGQTTYQNVYQPGIWDYLMQGAGAAGAMGAKL